VSLLLRHGADVNARSADLCTPLRLLCSCDSRLGPEHSAFVMTMLLDARADANHADDTGTTPLIAASKRGPSDSIRQLIAFKAEPNQADHEGYTPLMAAATARSVECVQVLLENGAKASMRDKKRQTALQKCFRQKCRYWSQNDPPDVKQITTILEEAEGREKAEEAAKTAETGQKRKRRM